MKSKNKKPNAWITGHTGFIGQQLTNELKQKNEIFKVSRNDIIEKNKYFKKKIKIDSVEKNKLKKFNNNYLFHLATLYNPNPKSNNEIKDIIESNLFFGLRLLEILGNNFFKKILLTQSYIEMQDNNKLNLYALTKKIFANELEKNFPNKIIKVYLYDTFGFNDKRGKLINIWLNKLILNKKITIFSKNTKINISNREFVSKIISKANKIKPGAYEIRSDVEMTLLDLFYLLKEITNSKSKLIIQHQKPVKIPRKYVNLSNKLKIKYDINDFEKDILKILKYEINV